ADPPGEFAVVGTTRRFDVVVRNGTKLEAAAGAVWESAFETDAASWKPPLLVAKLPGRTIRLHATLGDQKLSIAMKTVGEAPAGDERFPELRLFVGESKRFGSDIALPVANLDPSEVAAAVEAQSLVRFDPLQRALQGIAPGRTTVAVTAGRQAFALPV